MTVSLNTHGAIYQTFTKSDKYDDLKPCIESTVTKLLCQTTSSDRPGMLLGKIQSGKTRTFMGILALAFDNGFDVCVVLTKGTKALAKQTCQRIEADFADFEDDIRVHDIMTLPSLGKFALSQKLIFVVKKQTDNLERLQRALTETYPSLGQKRILVVDDEADFASVGYSKQKGTGFDLRTIAKQIDQLRGKLPQCSFLQVTATPYSLYLQPEEVKIGSVEFKPVRPAFTELVPVHPDYVGGDLYFPEQSTADENKAPAAADFIHVTVSKKEIQVLRKKDKRVLDPERALESKTIPTFRQAIVSFVVGATLRRLQAETSGEKAKRYSFLIHTEAAKGAHKWQAELTEQLKRQLTAAATADSAFLESLIEQAYQNLAQSISAEGYPLPSLALVQERVVQALAEEHLSVQVVNSDEEVVNMLDKSGQLRLEAPMNIFIGGQILDRGITIANMIGFYYGRSPKKFQQDTVLQHSRMYGFRPRQDVAVTRFYTATAIYSAMQRMQESDNALRRALTEHGDHSVIFIQKDEQGTIIPCNPAKISLSDVTTLRPYKRLLPVGFQSGFKTRIQKIITEMDDIIAPYVSQADATSIFELPLAVALDLVKRAFTCLEFEEPGYESNEGELIGALTHLSSNCPNPALQGKVLALHRTGRDIVRIKSNSSFMNAPDTSAREGKAARTAAQELPVLMLMRMEGQAEGWRGAAFYWPVVMTPALTKTAMFANTVRPDLEYEETSEEDTEED